jgi:hypothetical protein
MTHAATISRSKERVQFISFVLIQARHVLNLRSPSCEGAEKDFWHFVFRNAV